jgi:hypothetical protein
MTNDQLRDYLIESGKRSIENDPDFIPMLHVEQGEHVAIYALAVNGHPYDAIVQIAPSFILDGAIDRLVFVSDSYMWKGKEEDFVPGPLQPRFEAGEPNVSECLMNAVVTANGMDIPLVNQITMPYTRTDDGVVWDEALIREDGYLASGGRMVDLLVKVVLVSQGIAEKHGEGAPDA